VRLSKSSSPLRWLGGRQRLGGRQLRSGLRLSGITPKIAGQWATTHEKRTHEKQNTPHGSGAFICYAAFNRSTCRLRPSIGRSETVFQVDNCGSLKHRRLRPDRSTTPSKESSSCQRRDDKCSKG
jgi:hypothetical protein